MKLHNAIKILTLAALALFATIPASAARPAAKSVIEATAKKLREMPSMTATFKIVQGRDASQGSLTVSGRSFTVTTPEMKIWYDGKTQWAYSPSAKEVNITTPTAAEVAESNPLSVLTALTQSYTCRRLSSTAAVDKIELTPRNKTDISKAVISVNVSTGMPTEILAYRANGAVTKIQILTVKAGKKLAASAFRFNQKQYPGVEVVDLR